MEAEKSKKPFKGIGIWNFINKIPAGTMFVPLLISSVICTITVACGLGTGKAGEGMTLWQYLGNPVKDLFGSTGQMLMIGLMLFCTGTMIKPHDFVDVFKRGNRLKYSAVFMHKNIKSAVRSITFLTAAKLKGFVRLSLIL